MIKTCARCGESFDADWRGRKFCSRGCTFVKPEIRFRQRYSVHESGCWIWNGIRDRRGYGSISVNGIRLLAHRYAWMLVNGDIPEGMNACHHCDNPSCVNPAHLFLGTHADNVRDKVSKGRQLINQRNRRRGEDHPLAKLTKRDVVEIMNNPRESHTALARRLRVSRSAVECVRDGRTWRHVTLSEQNQLRRLA